jgi:hypothetical protein
MISPFRPFALLPALPFSATAGGGGAGGAPASVFLALLVPLAILRASCVLDFPKNQK